MLKVENIKSKASSYFQQVVEIRRHLHSYPELSFKEEKTSVYIQNKLTEAGIEFTSGHVNTGIIALLKGKNPEKRTILLRADMDALPILEKNETDYCSKNIGVMHACGHDVHSACVLGAALIINDLKNEFEGTVKVMFQPGEEVLPGGASLMIKAGVLENPKVDKAIALHVFPNMEAGTVGFREGMYMASTDELYLTVKGKGGHAAMPHEYVNPLIAVSEIILAINNKYMTTGATQSSEPLVPPTVVAFGKIEGKGETNVIPEAIELAGTFRTMDENWRREVHRDLNLLVQQIATKHGATATLRIEKGYPFLVNDPAFTKLCSNNAKLFLGKEKVEALPIRMTAEDFAYITQQVPSCFFRLGTGNKSRGITSGVHTATFDVDEKSLEVGAGLLAWLCLSELQQVT